MHRPTCGASSHSSTSRATCSRSAFRSTEVQAASGYFDDVDAAAAAVARWDGKASLYVTLNPINPSLLARAVNKIVERSDATTADADVLRRRWLFLDLDAVRPSGISSTDEELAQVKRSADEIAAFLRSRGWPEPVVVASGNGAYLLYRVDLPNDDVGQIDEVVEFHHDARSVSAGRLAGPRW
jgi:hypothetical protein